MPGDLLVFGGRVRTLSFGGSTKVAPTAEVVTGLADLTPTLRKAEARLGREVNVTSRTICEDSSRTGWLLSLSSDRLRRPRG